MVEFSATYLLAPEFAFVVFWAFKGSKSRNLLNTAAFKNLKCVIAALSSLRRRCPLEISALNKS